MMARVETMHGAGHRVRFINQKDSIQLRKYSDLGLCKLAAVAGPGTRENRMRSVAANDLVLSSAG